MHLYKNQSKEILYYKFLLSILVVVGIATSILRDFDHDELEAVHSAWKILDGERIYIDFFQHHHPLFYYSLIPIIHIFGASTATLLVLRFLMFSMFILFLTGTFKFSLTLFKDKSVAWLCIVLLSSMAMFTQKAIEIRPDVPQALLGLTAIFLLFRYIRNHRLNGLTLSAFCLGVSFLFLQKTIFIIASVGLIQLLWVYQQKYSFKELLIYWCVFVLTIAPYYAYLISYNQFENYLFWNWTLNMNFKGGFSAFNTLVESFSYNHFIWIFFVLGMVRFYKEKQFDVLLLSFLLLLSVFLVKAPYRQYFMPFIPFMCIISSYALLAIQYRKQRYILVTMIVLVPLVYFLRTIIVYPNQPQLKKIEWVLNKTNHGDLIYDGDVYFNVFRADVDFFWYSTDPDKGGLKTYMSLQEYDYDIYQIIENKKPKLISDLFIENITQPVISSNYTQSKKYPDLYIRNE
ncbi:MAG: glycosyltransferase family 39 protein [Reichenbachiella sp.]|uniref:ArnT family glycosyltransferase n=1 Tax=Reichenbachiella sp. TaxID=2184521 RepID=UPI0032980933